MGKNYHHRESGISLANHGPGCMWGILHHFQHNRWHNAKKRLTTKPDHSRKKSADKESIHTTSDAVEVQENIDPSVENYAVVTKSTNPTPSNKNTMKSRIKALITEEMSKRRGRHRRSTSYPTRTPLDRTLSIHHLESSGTDSPVENNSNHDTSGYRDSVHSYSSCELCSTMLKLNYLKQNEVNKLGLQSVRDHTLLRDKLIYAIEQSKFDSLQESKLFMDALDLLNLRKEVFLKILQDPSSSLAHQLQRRRAPSSRLGLKKSESFPVSGSSAKKPFDLDNSVTENIKSSFELDLSENASPTSANVLRKKHDNKLVLKRFKNLREKIKHVIRDRKKEKNRIVMDAVHHKIPYCRSENLRADIKEDNKFSNHNLSHQLFKRTSSFDESYDRYNRLIEINSNTEAKDRTSGIRLRFRTADNNTLSTIASRRAVLGRILSLPDLRSYSSIQIDESSNMSSLHNVENVAEQKLVRVASVNKVEPRGVSESPSRETLYDVGSTLDDSVDSKTWETASSHEFNLELMPSSAPQPLDSDQVSEDESNYDQEDELGLVPMLEDSKFPTEDDSSSAIHEDLSNLNPCISSENTVDVDALESHVIKKLYDELLRVHVDTKNISEFNYVKDVLELSGFSRDELLGKWHSTDHPLNPLVFEEVEGCLVSQPDCYGNEEGGNCDHLLLFNLINEVLLDIHERSFCYWPEPLTVRSHVHRMPKGYHVLEEVWGEISLLLRWRPEIDQTIDDAVGRDLGKRDRWMDLQLDAEFVGVELEDLIFDDILEEVILE